MTIKHDDQYCMYDATHDAKTACITSELLVFLSLSSSSNVDIAMTHRLHQQNTSS